MTHHVYEMAYSGDTPWHGLGANLNRRQPLETWAVQAGMNWHILESPVQFSPGGIGQNSGVASFPEKKVLFRSDTSDALSVVSKRYKVVQPREILEFYRDLTEIAGFELETAGVLKGGRKCWALARTNHSMELRGRDVIHGYLLLATACDGTLATVAKFTSIRVVCNNTLEVALDSSGATVKVPHSTSFDPAKVKKQLGLTVSAWDEFRYKMKLMSERKVKTSEAVAYFRVVFSGHDALDPVSERAMKQVLALYEGNGRGSELASAKGTAFGLVNAVTEFVDHERRARSTGHRLESAWFGLGAEFKTRAFNEGVSLL